MTNGIPRRGFMCGLLGTAAVAAVPAVLVPEGRIWVYVYNDPTHGCLLQHDPTSGRPPKKFLPAYRDATTGRFILCKPTSSRPHTAILLKSYLVAPSDIESWWTRWPQVLTAIGA